MSGIGNDGGFEQYLKARHSRNIRQLICYARRYHDILNTGDISPIVDISSSGATIRRHVMEALTAYAKFSGCYDRWCYIRKCYSLHWTDGNESVQSLQRFFNPELSLDKLLYKIREMLRVLPTAMTAVVRHAVLTGLRPTEAIESVKLLNSADYSAQYYNQERQALEHFRFPELFIRATKKAFVSYITLDNLQPIRNLGGQTPTWKAIRSACKRRGINMDMRYCRKVHGSWLHKHGVSTESIDFLHGRTSPSIFSRHYLSPDNTLREQVLEAIQKLHDQF